MFSDVSGQFNGAIMNGGTDILSRNGG